MGNGILAMIFTLFFATGASADCLSNRGHDLIFPKGKKIRVVSYDKKSKTYAIASYDFPGEGKSIVLPESLVASVPSLKSIESILKSKPDDIVDEVYITQKDIPTMFEKEVSERTACLMGAKTK